MVKGISIKKYNEFKKSYPQQLDLFSELGGVFQKEREKYSTTAELYDVVPKYVLIDIEKLRTKEGFLPILNRDFVFKKQDMKIKITPALLEVENGKSRAFYPSTREEIIEDVLRKFATDPNKNEFLDDRLTVKFTLYELWKELRKIKHPYDYNQIREGLNILAKTNIEIKSKDNKVTFTSNMFETFGIVDSNNNAKIDFDNEYSKKVTYFVRFNSLVSESVKNKTWRLINYNQCMSYKKGISRWLHKRISNLFLNAKLEIPYNILLSTVVRDSGMTEYKQLRDSKRQIISCLDEMVKVGSLDHYVVENVFDSDRSNKIVDAKFLLYISECFFNDIQKGFLKDKELKYVYTLNREIQTENQKNIENNSAVKDEIVNLLKHINIEEEDINKIISSKKNQKILEQIKINVIAGIQYIEKQNNTNSKCNKLAIILAGIKNNWKVVDGQGVYSGDYGELKTNTVITSNSASANMVVIDKKAKIKENIANIKDKTYKKMASNLLKYFGDDIYLNWLSKLNFVSLEQGVLTLSSNISFVIETIKKDYLKGTKKIENGETIWLRKGIKELVQDVDSGIKKVEIIEE